MVADVGEWLCLRGPTQWVPSCMKQKHRAAIKIRTMDKVQKNYQLVLLIVIEMSQFVKLPTTHLFQMSVISSPRTVSVMTCVWALE